MRTVVLASLRTHTRRYVSAALAIVIGVGFVVVTAGLTSAARDGLTEGLSAPYDEADVAVTGLGGADAARLVEASRRAGAEASVLGWLAEPVLRDGRRVEGLDEVGPVADGDLRWQELVTGRFPAAPGEAVVDVEAAGDRVRVGDGLEVAGRDVEVVGLVRSPFTFAVADVYVPWADLAPRADQMYVDSVAWAGDPAAATAAVPSASVVPADDYVDDLAEEVNQGVDVVAVLLLVFATIALVVGVLVIANTFSILFAQRRHDLALLRCVGATRRQLLRAIRAEALVLGLVATTLGLVAGTLAGRGLVALVRSRWPESRLGEASVPLSWYAGALVVGVLVTLVASWLPTRAATRADPLTALRPDATVDARSTAGRVRLATGGVLVAGGVALLAVAVSAHTVPVMLAGGVASFLGVLVLGPWIVPALVSAAGGLLARAAGPAARLATGNAVRHPKRTATTAASLLVGVTLTTAVLTGMASSRSAIGEETDGDHPVDVAVTATRALPDGTLDTVRARDDVETVTALAGTTVQVGGDEVVVLAVDETATTAARDPAAVTPADGEVLLPLDLATRARAVLTGDGGSVRLDVVGTDVVGDVALVTPSTLAALAGSGATPETRGLWVRARDGADAERLGDDLSALTASSASTVENGLADRAWVDQQLDVLTYTVVGLLGVAVLIALVGIANTLGLSVLERTREHALLRAVGLTRRQLRSMLAVEAVLLAVVATVLGTAVGVTFAWVAVVTMVQPVVAGAPLVLPWGQLAVVVLVAALAGLLACLVPARRAARVSPASGLALP